VKTIIAVIACVFAAVLGTARADTTLEEHISVNGVGMMSFANMSGTSRSMVSGEHSRHDSDLQMESRLVRFLARNAVGPSAEIVRLDEDKIYHLEIRKKEYSETTFEQMRSQMQQAAQKMQEAKDKQPSPVDDSQCEWSDPKAEVKRSGEKMTIAGYPAERLTIVTSQDCKDKKTGSVCRLALALDQWLSSDFSNAEVTRFQRAYAQKLGLASGITPDLSDRAQSMFGRYKGVWAQVVEKMKDSKGYPVKSSFAFAFGGPQCASDKSRSDSNASSAQDSSASADSSPSGPKAMASQLSGRLASMLGRKKKDDSAKEADSAGPAPAAAPASAILPDNMIPLITMSSELVSVSTAAVPGEMFAVPADFKKVSQ